MRAILVLFIVLVAGSLHAQEILAQEHWPDGTLKATRYATGQRINFITYHENGRVKEMGEFLKGKRNGVWKQYSDTGALLAQAGFRNGERQGTWEIRDAEDRTTGRMTYAAGVLAQAEQYDGEGALVAQRSY